MKRAICDLNALIHGEGNRISAVRRFLLGGSCFERKSRKAVVRDRLKGFGDTKMSIKTLRHRRRVRDNCMTKQRMIGRGQSRERLMLAIERLEDRRLLTITANYTGTTLSIHADPGDTLAVSKDPGGGIDVSGSLVAGSSAAAVTKITIDQTSAGANPIKMDLSGVTTANFGSLTTIAVGTLLAASDNFEFSNFVNEANVALQAKTSATTKFDAAFAVTLKSLDASTSGTTDLNGGSVTTSAGQSYGAVLLSADATLTDTGSNNNITFNSTVQSDALGPWAFTVRNDGTTDFKGFVGSGVNGALKSVTTEGYSSTAVGTTQFDAGNASNTVTTTQTQNYDNAVKLGANTKLVSTGAAAVADITFGSTIGYTTATPEALTFSTAGRVIYREFTGNSTRSTAASLGVGPGIHLFDSPIDPGENDWYAFQVLRPDTVDVKIAFDTSVGPLSLDVLDSAGNVLQTGSATASGAQVSSLAVQSGLYYVHVSGGAAVHQLYSLAVDRSAAAPQIYYVNDASSLKDVYSLAPGNDANDGLTPQTPKASVQSVLNTYALGPGNLVLVDTGTYSGSTIQITAPDKRAAYAGSANGTTFSMGFALTDADYDMITGFTFAGFGGPGIAVQPSAVNDSTHNNFINNTFSGLSTAIQITNGSFDVVSGNTISGGSYGVLLSDCGTEAVSNNAITGATYSTYDSGGSAVAIYSNTLATGSYGVFVQSDTGALIHDNSITGFTTDGIFDSSSGPVYGNQVSSSGTGIYSQGSAIIYGNTVHNDTTGLSGYGSFGGSDWSAPNLVYSNQTGIAAFGASSAAFNRVYSNVVGIDLHDTASANHNLVYRNSNLGILVDGAHNLAVLNNTVYIPAGYAGSPDAIRLQGGANNITLENNILWSDSGYDLYVTTDSQIGFKSDYNNLYTTGSGKLVWWQKDFGDLFDWQVEAAYDTHSIGYTTISPTLDNPQFVNLATDDYHLTAVTSTSIAAGDPTSAFNLQPNPSGGRIEIGAYGNTSGAALAAANFIRIDYPNFYTDWEVTVGHAIQWNAYNLTGNVASTSISKALVSSRRSPRWT